MLESPPDLVRSGHAERPFFVSLIPVITSSFFPLPVFCSVSNALSSLVVLHSACYLHTTSGRHEGVFCIITIEMGSSGVQVSYGWLDTMRALFFPCFDGKDPRSESSSGVCDIYPAGDTLPRHQVLNRQDPPEKRYYQISYEQPAPVLPPRAQRRRASSMGKVLRENKRAAPKQADMGWIDRNFRSGKRKAPRPLISGPFNFQHTGTGAVSFTTSAADLPRSAPPFRPLELSIYRSNDQISPLMPYFTRAAATPSPPPRALTRDTFDEDASTLAHSRSYSSTSFHIPRRPVNDVASFTTGASSSTGDSPPRIPPRARTRPRAYTSPSVEAIVERIAGAMIEKERLDEEIESVKERQSFCLSRPGSVYGLPGE